MSRRADQAALLVAAILVIGSVTLAAAEEPQQAGVAAAVRGNVDLTRPSANIADRQVRSGDPIFLGDAITSGKASGMQIMLMDETVFSIGPNSEVVIDEFVYDPATDPSKGTMSVTEGVFRFINGKIVRQRPEDRRARLPTSTQGIMRLSGSVKSD